MASGTISLRENEKLLTVLNTLLFSIITSQHVYTCLCICMKCPYMPELPKHEETIVISCN